MQSTKLTPNSNNARVFLSQLYWMGPGTLPMVIFQSVFVSLSLVTQLVLELNRFRGQDLSGPSIAIGMLRELGPLTGGLAWVAVAALRRGK